MKSQMCNKVIDYISVLYTAKYSGGNSGYFRTHKLNLSHELSRGRHRKSLMQITLIIKMKFYNSPILLLTLILNLSKAPYQISLVKNNSQLKLYANLNLVSSHWD